MRSKSKKALHGSAGAKTDQQPQPTQRRDAMPAPLQLAEKPLYYPGTSMPMEGWFHACRCVDGAAAETARPPVDAVLLTHPPTRCTSSMRQPPSS
jgi:hypothetical protein